jgi:S-adenosylmethionine hydrolase
MSRPIVTLTTDFGQTDGYVGTMKGVVLGICPKAVLVDISHEIRPQAMRQAAYVLSTAVPYFPPDTVHLVVVDPGVGSERRPIAVQTERARDAAPDNGVLSSVLAQEPARLAVDLAESPVRLPQASATFHGRDIFAPAAAHLALGADLSEIGTPIPTSSLVTLANLQPKAQADGSWLGEILHVDRFGNLITNFQTPTPQFPTPGSPIPNPQISILLGGVHISGLSRTFASVAPGELVAYIGSSGCLEIAVREGNAATQLKLDVGDPVQVEGLALPRAAVAGAVGRA